MPHLSPLSWIMAPLMFWSMFSIIKAHYWWFTPPQLTSPLHHTPSYSNLWSWT